MKNKAVLIFVLIVILISTSCSPKPETGSDPLPLSSGSSTATPTAIPTLSQQGTPNANLIDQTENATEPELPPFSYEYILNDGIDDGTWTKEEGLIAILGSILGEPVNGSLEIADPVFISGTTILSLADEYINDPTSDTDTSEEMRRLYRQLVIPQEILDAVSVPEETINSSHQPAAKKQLLSYSPRPQTQVEEGCDAIINPDFLLPDEHIGTLECFVYRREVVNGTVLRVFYPIEVRADQELWEEVKPFINDDFNALMKAVEFIHGLDGLNLPNIDLNWNWDKPAEFPFYSASSNLDGSQWTIYMDLDASTTQVESAQLIALEVSTIAGRITFPNASTSAWWNKASAWYFSNVIEPRGNLEYQLLPYFDSRSTHTPITEMVDENFIFFQYLGNVLGPQGVVDFIKPIQSEPFWYNPLFEQGSPVNFNQFVVLYLSSGISDQRTGVFSSPSPPRVTDRITIQEAQTYSFDPGFLVAARYQVDYKKERRFLQRRGSEGYFYQFSAVLKKSQRELGAWSDLPPEIRSSCKEDSSYYFVMTKFYKARGAYPLEVSKVEEAVCDPCVLGTWQIDNPSFAAHMDAIFESQPETAQISQAWEFDITGDYFLQFDDEANIFTRRENFGVRLVDLPVHIPSPTPDINYPGPMPFVPPFTVNTSTVITSSGVGKYTTDGKEMKFLHYVDVPNLILGEDGDGYRTFTYEGGSGVFSTGFGAVGLNNTVDGGLASMDEPMDETVEYKCDNESLKIIMPATGKELFLWRVDKILPTPIPTPGGPENP